MVTSKENNLNKYVRKVDKKQIPTCNIMGVKPDFRRFSQNIVLRSLGE